jgi:hypothetical protein
VLAWALAEPDTRLRDLVVHGAVLTVEAAELPKPAWGPLWKAATEPPIEMDRRILRRTVARLAEETLTLLGDTGGDLLAGADRVGRASLTPTQLQTSRVLPLAFSDRCHALAQQAAAGKPISSADIVWLTSHRAAQMNRGDLAVIEAMARISRYLDQPFSPKTDLLEQVRDYQRSGASTSRSCSFAVRWPVAFITTRRPGSSSRRAAIAGTERTGTSRRRWQGATKARCTARG